eukprot:symbB.v1.2.037608.t1/scaffold5600.1/size25446/3
MAFGDCVFHSSAGHGRCECHTGQEDGLPAPGGAPDGRSSTKADRTLCSTGGTYRCCAVAIWHSAKYCHSCTELSQV